MNEAWHFMPGRWIWSLCRRGDEARLHFYFAKIIVRLGLALAANLPPAGWIESFESSSPHKKTKTIQWMVFVFWSG